MWFSLNDLSKASKSFGETLSQGSEQKNQKARELGEELAEGVKIHGWMILGILLVFVMCMGLVARLITGPKGILDIELVGGAIVSFFFTKIWLKITLWTGYHFISFIAVMALMMFGGIHILKQLGH
ncbi:MAG: hypothetical protein SF002_12320 [Alphaproteobacteria bacterium]|nr:hypothetical protein [Alphaproteobacteria bacterium]